MVSAMLMLSPIVLAVAFLLAIVARRYGPQGIPYLLWAPLLFVWLMGGLATFFTMILLGVDGANAQQRLLGRQYAGVLQLRGYRNSEFPDPGQQWHYRLDPDTVARLRPKCRVPDGLPPGTCYLYFHSDDREAVSVTLEGNELIVADWSL